MTKRNRKREERPETGRPVSRPEDPDTQRQRRAARLLRADMLPMGAAMVTQDEDLAKDSETKAALKRATDARDRN